MLKRKNKPIFVALAAMICAAAVLSCSFAILGLYPFGAKSMIVSDLAAQYTPFLAWFQDILQGQAGLLYSFSIGIGENMLPLFTYYLCSPFNLLVAPFSKVDLPNIVTFIVFLKIIFSAATMGFCLRKMCPRAGWMALPFAVAWSLCGFVSSYFFNIIWLDVMIWLPLTVYGLSLLFERGRPGLYIAALFLMTISNYYMAYMACLFLLIYGIFELIGRKSYPSAADFFRDNRSRILLFAVSTVLSLGIAAVLLAPAAAGMLGTGKSSFDPLVFNPVPLFGFDGLGGFFLGSGTFASRHTHLPTLFAGTFTLISAMMYFRCENIAKRRRVLSAALLFILGLALCFKPLSAVFQMFQPVAGFPYRHAFLVIFVLCLIACKAWAAVAENSGASKASGASIDSGASGASDNSGASGASGENGTRLRLPERFSPVRAAVLCIAAIGVALCYNRLSPYLMEILGSERNIPPLRILYLFIAAVVVIGTGLLLIKFKKYGRRQTLVIVCLVLFAELITNFCLAVGNGEFMEISTQRSFLQKYDTAAEKISDNNDFFRVGNHGLLSNAKTNIFAWRNGYNHGLLMNYPGLMGYSSTISSKTRDLYQTLGLNTVNDRRISSVGSTEFSDLLFDAEWRFRSTGGAIQLERTSDTVGAGFLCNPEILRKDIAPKKAPEKGAGEAKGRPSPLDTQNRIFGAMSGAGEALFVDNAIKVNEKKKDDGKYYYDIAVTMSTDGVAYACPAGPGKTYRDLTVNGQLIRYSVRVKERAPLRLGKFKKGDEVHVMFNTMEKKTFKPKHFMTLDSAVLGNFEKQAGANALKLTYDKTAPILRGTALSGTIEAPNDALLFLSIPYDKSWRLSVNGRSAETLPVLRGLSAAYVKKGENKLSLRYEPKGLKEGAAVSALSLIATFALLLALRRRKGLSKWK